jgi:hypothetical protein
MPAGNGNWGRGVRRRRGEQVTSAEMFGDVIEIEPDMSISPLILQNHVSLS